MDPLNVPTIKTDPWSVCRTCLSPDAMTSLADYSAEAEGFTLGAMLEKIAGVSMEGTEEFPNVICANCERDLCSAIAFRCRAQLADKQLREKSFTWGGSSDVIPSLHIENESKYASIKILDMSPIVTLKTEDTVRIYQKKHNQSSKYQDSINNEETNEAPKLRKNTSFETRLAKARLFQQANFVRQKSKNKLSSLNKKVRRNNISNPLSLEDNEAAVSNKTNKLMITNKKTSSEIFITTDINDAVAALTKVVNDRRSVRRHPVMNYNEQLDCVPYNFKSYSPSRSPQQDSSSIQTQSQPSMTVEDTTKKCNQLKRIDIDDLPLHLRKRIQQIKCNNTKTKTLLKEPEVEKGQTGKKIIKLKPLTVDQVPWKPVVKDKLYPHLGETIQPVQHTLPDDNVSDSPIIKKTKTSQALDKKCSDKTVLFIKTDKAICESELKQEMILKYESENPKNIDGENTNNNLTCKVCEEVLPNQDSLQKHREQHTDPFSPICPHPGCGRIFVSLPHLVKHRKLCHKSSKHDPNNRKYFVCITCGERCNSKSQAIIHMKIHKEMKLENAFLNKEEKPKKKEKVVPCPECGERFRSQYDVLLHKRRKHTGEKPYKCTECEKCFVSKIQMKKHKETHFANRERPFICMVCGKGCFRKSQLDIHMQSHSDLRNFECTECGRWFGLKGNLIAHAKRIHGHSKTDIV